MAAGALPSVWRGDHVLGVGGDRQGGGGDPRVRLGRGGGGELDAAVSPEEPERQWLLQRLAPLVGVEAVSPAERQELFTAWRRSSRGWPPPGRPCSCSRICTGQTRPCSRSWSIWRSGLRGCRCWFSARRGRSSTRGIPVGRADTERDDDQPAAALGSGDGRTRLHLITTTVLSEELEQGVLERAGGNPLYAEEFGACSPTAASSGRERSCRTVCRR